MEPKSTPAPKAQLPYIDSRYLSRIVYLDQIADLSDKELKLLETECQGVHEDFSATLKNGYSAVPRVAERIIKTSGRFLYAIEREMAQRSKNQSILKLLQELAMVRAERDALQADLDYYLDHRGNK